MASLKPLYGPYSIQWRTRYDDLQSIVIPVHSRDQFEMIGFH